jgi:predicted ATPase/DNA-binding XRE family transcriptional regulator
MKQPAEATAFGVQLRGYRVAAGLTQAALAEQAGLSRRGIADLERGARLVPHQHTIRQLSEALGLAEADRAALVAAGRRAVSVVSNGRSMLPFPATSFVGREGQLTRLQRLLGTSRLLTLTGAGGIGKTRLALEVARKSLLEVTLVELAPLADPELVPQAVAAALEVMEQPPRPLLHTLLDALRGRHILLVLDNCEHLVQAAAEVAQAVVEACPEVRILATSREPLGVAGEVTWRVPALSLPPSAGQAPIDELSRYEAVQLFVQRACQSRPDFELTPHNASGVAQVCRRLDGIPLAIELAAPRVNALSVDQIAQRLDDALSLLTGGSRTAQARHRTLRGTLDWSYALLTEMEQLLLRRVAVFAGGWTLELAEDICTGEGIERSDVLQLLAALVDKSLVVAEERDRAVRYSLLDPLRAYASEKLAAAGEEDRVRRLHMECYVRLAEEFDLDWRSPRQRDWLDKLRREQDNLRAALRWSVEHAEVTYGLRLGSAMRMFFDVAGRLSEGRAWLAELLGQSGATLPEPVLAKALHAAGYLANFRGDPEAAQGLLEKSLDLWRRLGDRRGIARTLLELGNIAQMRNDPATAGMLIDESLAISRALGDRITEYIGLHYRASVALRGGDLVHARLLQEESLALKLEQGDAYAASFSLNFLALLAWKSGDSRATELAAEALQSFADIGVQRGVSNCLQLLADISAATDASRTARLFAASQALDEVHGGRPVLALRSEADRAQREATLANLRDSMQPAAFEAAWREGRAMSMDDAVAFALTRADAVSSPTARGRDR